MKNKKIIFGIAVIFFIIIAAAKINSQRSDTQVSGIKNKTSFNQSASDNSQTNKVQVFLFHATKRCPTCIRIGQLAKATVEERFSEELKSGAVEFREINIDLPENKELAQKFQAAGSVLYLNAIKNGEDNIEQDIKVWSLVSNGDEFKNYLENKINNLLGR